MVKNNKGQGVVESVLIIVVLFGITKLVALKFKDDELFKSLLHGPWLSLSSVIQNGVWNQRGPQDTKANHPNRHVRHASVKGDP